MGAATWADSASAPRITTRSIARMTTGMSRLRPGIALGVNAKAESTRVPAYVPICTGSSDIS